MEKFSDLSNSQIRCLIDEWLHSSRDRSMMKDYLIDGMTFEEMADKYCISVRWTKELVSRSMNAMKSHRK